MTTATMEARPASLHKRVRVGSPVYNEIVEFLYEEAALLDDLRLAEWSELLAKDLAYSAPVRVTRSLAQKDKSIIRTVQHFDDDYDSIMGRIGRLTNTTSAWAEDPPSRTRRFITNVLVRETDKPDEFAVVSYLYLTRSRMEDYNAALSAVRHDVLRRDGDSFKLARRETIVDQSVLSMSNFAIFL